MTSDTPVSRPRPSRVWFITGASSGFGRLLAEKALERGERVVATARDRSRIADLETRYPEAARALTLDVTRPDQVSAVVPEALAAFGGVDILANNAGYGVCGAVEEVAEDEFEPMFQTNLYGLLRVTRAFLPHFRQRRGGHILNLSSMAGLTGAPGWGLYAATKFAVEGLSEALAAELAPLGVRVTLIEPGPFRTEFLGRSGIVAKVELPDYASTVGKTRDYFRTQNGRQPGDPAKAIEAIFAVVDSPEPPLRLLLGKVAMTRLRAKFTRWEKELSDWEPVTLGADFPGM